MKIYIVMGTRGEYSDRDEWVIKAYSDEKLAQKHVLDAQEFSDKNTIECEKLSDEGKYKSEIMEAKSPFDEKFEPCTGYHSYFLVETELDETNLYF